MSKSSWLILVSDPDYSQTELHQEALQALKNKHQFNPPFSKGEAKIRICHFF